MRSSTKKRVLGAVAVAGVVAASGSAFTAGGVTRGAGPTQFIGGTVSQSVSGSATLSGIAYNHPLGNSGNTITSSVDLTFAESLTGKTVAAVLKVGTADTSLTCQTTSDPLVTHCASADGSDVSVANVDSISVTVGQAA